jgi:hypothetical protein
VSKTFQHAPSGCRRMKSALCASMGSTIGPYHRCATPDNVFGKCWPYGRTIEGIRLHTFDERLPEVCVRERFRIRNWFPLSLKRNNRLWKKSALYKRSKQRELERLKNLIATASESIYHGATESKGHSEAQVVGFSTKSVTGWPRGSISRKKQDVEDRTFSVQDKETSSPSAGDSFFVAIVASALLCKKRMAIRYSKRISETWGNIPRSDHWFGDLLDPTSIGGHTNPEHSCLLFAVC